MEHSTEAELLQKIGEEYNIHLLRLHTLLPDLKVNVYLVHEPVPTLIDAPPDGPPFMDELERGLKDHGLSLGDIKRVIVTHHHADHFGCSAKISERSNAEIWASQGAGAWLENCEAQYADEERFCVHLLTNAGVPTELTEHSIGFIRLVRQFSRPVRPTRFLHEGDRITMSSPPFNVLSVPGHTPWCMLIHDCANRIAFTGDFLLRQVTADPLSQRTSVVPKGYKGLNAYISSLKRVKNMGLETTLPGHGEVIENPSARIDELISFIYERKKLVLKILRKEGNKKTAYQILKTMFPQFMQERLFLGVSDITGYLELLEEEGLAERRQEECLYFSPT